jgi:hypothetical protein
MSSRSISKVANSLTKGDDRSLLHHARVAYTAAYGKLKALEKADSDQQEKDDFRAGLNDEESSSDSGSAGVASDDSSADDSEASADRDSDVSADRDSHARVDPALSPIDEPYADTTTLRLHSASRRSAAAHKKAPVLKFKHARSQKKSKITPLSFVMPP